MTVVRGQHTLILAMGLTIGPVVQAVPVESYGRTIPMVQITVIIGRMGQVLIKAIEATQLKLQVFVGKPLLQRIVVLKDLLCAWSTHNFLSKIIENIF